MTDLAPHRQCAAVFSRLQGQALEIPDTLLAIEVAAGVIRDGIHVDPVSNLMGLLAARLSPFED